MPVTTVQRLERVVNSPEFYVFCGKSCPMFGGGCREYCPFFTLLSNLGGTA